MSAVIRLAGDGDAAAVAAIYAPFVDGNATSFEAEPPSADEMRRRIDVRAGVGAEVEHRNVRAVTR